MWRAYLRLPQLFGACRVVLLAWMRQLQHRGIAVRLYGIAFLGFAAMLVLASLAVFCVQGDQLQDTIFSISFAALSLAGPLSLLVVHGVVMRINAITDGMRRIALNETSIAVPSVGDSDEIGEMARALEVFKNNATTLAGNAKEIEKLNHWFDIALNSMARGLSMFDADRRLIVCNRRYHDMYNLPAGLCVPGTSLSAIAEHWHAENGAQNGDSSGIDQWFAELEGHLARRIAFSEKHCLADGRTVHVHVQPIPDGGWVDVHEDITEKQQAEARITQLARFDTLTGLANRHHFLEALEAAFGRDETDQAGTGKRFAALWIDLDKFKDVNDTLGHPAGDALLKLVAGRLRATVRSDDVIARLGGDEFAILVQGSSIAEDVASALADRLIAKLSAPFEIANQTIRIGASIGIVLAPDHGATADDLLKNADIALYRAKTGGRGTSVVYLPEFELKIRARRQLEIDLRRAVDAGELTLNYQPILDLKAMKVASCEALMRWKHPQRGMISPAEFIPVAEEIGLIDQMGKWALDQACRDAMRWPNFVKVAVNLSADQFVGSGLLDAAKEALEKSGLPASRLELEVTEGLLLQDNASTLATLSALRSLGIGIALDDFGTGYASLSYLRSFPFDKIKIDQSFVRDLPSREDCVAIVQAVVNLAKSLGMRTVAEGVETAEHLERVAQAGCDEVQGYYFSRPVSADVFTDVLGTCSERLGKVA